MSPADTQTEACQVDFYLLQEGAPEANEFACRLALMAWEHGQRIFVTTTSGAAAEELDELMWQYPPARFLPHAGVTAAEADKAAINIGELSGLQQADVVINLATRAIPEAARFRRILEIVPLAHNERQASREKYKSYRDLGLTPRTHEISQ